MRQAVFDNLVLSLLVGIIISEHLMFSIFLLITVMPYQYTSNNTYIINNVKYIYYL